MEKLFVKSILGDISNRLDSVLPKLSDKKIAIYEMDEYSFAIQSLLKNRENSADYYVLDNKARVIEEQRRISGISIRYMRSNDIVEIKSSDELDKEKDVLLIASRNSEELVGKLIKNGWKEKIHFFLLYDWSKDDFSNFVQNKEKIELQEIQSIEKDILKVFDAFCLEKGLRYWVCGGTLLGTIRHKGFIPWDDDIDVFMPWEDYKIFVELYQDNEEYKVACMQKESYLDKCKCYWGKMIEEKTISREDAGLMQEIHPSWIDIFPIIGLPEDEEERVAYFKQAVELNRRFTEEFYRNNGSIRKRNQIYYEFVKMFEKYDFDSSKYVGIIGTQYGVKDCTSRAMYNDTIRMPFDDIEVNVCKGYTEYLDNIYGPDWMQIPDESKRRGHNLEAYWL